MIFITRVKIKSINFLGSSCLLVANALRYTGAAARASCAVGAL